MNSKISLLEFIKASKRSFNYLLDKKLYIIITCIVFSLIGVLYIWRQEPKYTAEVTFVAENDKASGAGAYASIAAQFGLNLGGGGNSAFQGDNLVELLKSRVLIDRTLLSFYDDKKLLIDQYIDNHRIREGWDKNPLLKSIKFDNFHNNSNLVRDSIFNGLSTEIIKTRLDVNKLDKQLDIIFIKMTDNDQFFAKRFVEELCKNAIQFYTQYKMKKNLENVNILQKQVDSVKYMLFGNISDAASINDLNINPLKQSLRTSSQKKQVDMQVNAALYTELLKNLELSKITMRKETPLIQVIDTPHLPLRNEKKGRLFGAVVFGFIGFVFSVIFFLLQKEIKNLNVI